MSCNEKPQARFQVITLKGVGACTASNNLSDIITRRQIICDNSRADCIQTSHDLAIQMYSRIKCQRELVRDRNSQISRAVTKRLKLKKLLETSSSKHSTWSGLSFGEFGSKNRFLKCRMTQIQDNIFVTDQEHHKSLSDPSLRRHIVQTDHFKDGVNSLEPNYQSPFKDDDISKHLNDQDCPMVHKPQVNKNSDLPLSKPQRNDNIQKADKGISQTVSISFFNKNRGTFLNKPQINHNLQTDGVNNNLGTSLNKPQIDHSLQTDDKDNSNTVFNPRLNKHSGTPLRNSQQILNVNREDKHYFHIVYNQSVNNNSGTTMKNLPTACSKSTNKYKPEQDCWDSLPHISPAPTKTELITRRQR